jgi:hypothetical protein
MPAGMIAGATSFRPILARIGHEAQITFPRGACLAIGGCHAIGIAAVGDCLDLLGGLQNLQVGVVSAADVRTSTAIPYAV